MMDIMDTPTEEHYHSSSPEKKKEKKKSTRETLVGLACLSSGLALTCSYFMMAQMLKNDGVMFGSVVITYAWPGAVLLASITLARMYGHFHHRGMQKGSAVAASGFLFLETISIATSFFSAQMSMSGGAAGVMGGRAGMWCLLLAVSLSVIALLPAMCLEMMRGNKRNENEGEQAGKKSKYHLRVVK